jgi:hypothetical protein
VGTCVPVCLRFCATTRGHWAHCTAPCRHPALTLLLLFCICLLLLQRILHLLSFLRSLCLRPFPPCCCWR